MLFYASYNTDLFNGAAYFNNGEVYNRDHHLMLNGDSITFQSWYLECTIIPFPNDTSKYYLFTIGITSNYGLYYSIIDMTQDSGRGAVILKNVQLQNWQAVDGMTAIKHGNGRDWWVLVRQWDNTNSHDVYLISTLGIIKQPTQFVGSLNNTNAGRYNFSRFGNKLSFVNYKGLIQLYDFDRCSGIISNPVT